MYVMRQSYPKYACSCCKDGVTSAERAASPIERGLAGPGLVIEGYAPTSGKTLREIYEARNHDRALRELELSVGKPCIRCSRPPNSTTTS
jgi:hypothetical protein